MLVMLLGVATGAMATEYVTDVMLLGSGSSAGKKKQEYIDKGWKDTNYNLNKGTGSSTTNIYLLYKTGPNKADAITGFYLQCGKDTRQEKQVKDGHTYLPVEGEYDSNFVKNQCNLNNNVSGSNRIYLFYTKESFDDRDPITEIWFDNAKTAAVGSNGDDDSPCDLNSGGGGSYIYMHVFYGERSNCFDYEERAWEAENKKVVTTTKSCNNFTRLTSNSNDNHTVLKDGWYVVDHDIEYQEYLDIDGDVKIILQNGKTMNANNGIRIKTDKKLTIYGQSGDSGTIKADGSIGGKGDIYAGELIIHGGTIDCKGKSVNNAAIGSGNGANNKKAGYKAITIYGGNVTATGANSGAGIGSGQDCNDDYQGPITIYGGTVNAKGGFEAAGIGGGEESGNGPIYIYGGNVTADGDGSAIGCGQESHLCNDIYILGGTVNIEGYNDVGIGQPLDSYGFPDYDLYIQDATVNISVDRAHAIWVRDFHVINSNVKLFTNYYYGALETEGSIYLADNLLVEYPNFFNTLYWAPKGFREKKLTEESDCEIKVCNHVNAYCTDNGDGTHAIPCDWCCITTGEHSYERNKDVYVCTKCRAKKEITELAQALWFESNKTLYFLNSKEYYQAGDNYNGNVITSVWSGDQVTNTGNNAPGWSTVKTDATTVVFEASFADVRPRSLCQWFAGYKNLSSIRGIEYLNTSECTTMYGMFSNCSSLTSIDVSGFDIRKVDNVQYMFQNCKNLKIIYCDNTWRGISKFTDMFTGCKSLKGSMGTVSYDDNNYNNITYANPSTGYFTNTGTIITQAVWCDDNKTLYFTCPKAPVKAGETFDGVTVTSVWGGGHVLATGDTAPGWSNVKDEAIKVVFDASFSQAKPTSLVSWFSDFTSLTTAIINNLNVSEAESAASMFSGCTNLTTIYCPYTWTIANTEGMFKDCTSLRGVVNYDAFHENGTMANPTTGYFTKNWVVILLNDGITASNQIPLTNETVTISGTGDSGEGIAAITVTGQRTDSVYVVTDNGDGTWSFTMPAENVTVKEEITINLYDKPEVASSRTRGITDSNSEVLRRYKGKTVNVIYDRILSATDNGDGTWSSRAFAVCLPYRRDLQDEFYAGQLRLYKLASVTSPLQLEGSGEAQFIFDAVEPAVIEGGVSYLMVVDQGSVNLSAEGVEIQAIANDELEDGTVYSGFETQGNPDGLRGWWRGTFEYIDNEEGSQLHAFCLNSDGKWRMIRNDTEVHSKAYIPPFRAYFLPKDYFSDADHSIRLINSEAGEDMKAFWEKLPHSYEGDINYDDASAIQPVIHTIDADGTHTYYDLQGRKLDGKPATKGVYINNGRSVIIK